MKSFLLCLFSCIITEISPCNIETRFPILFHGYHGSYFGFSVALHENNEGNMALITATRANSSYGTRQKLHQPGVLYKCNITSQQCQEIVLNKIANEVSQINLDYPYYANEDDMWLGISLDVHPNEGNIVTCGHLWKNQYYKSHYLANGICYLMDRNMTKNRIKKLLPFIKRDKQSIGDGIYYYAFAQAGISAVFSEDGRTLLIGSPGFYDWIGTAINYLIPMNYRNIFPPFIPDPPGDQQPSPEAYIGYSVTTGKFFELGELQFVAGAPRDGQYKGRIYIYEEALSDQTNMIVIQKKEGSKVGEYFGASVLGVNVNNDKFTDLLVGAPFYTHPSGSDEGIVYVFISNGKGLEKTEVLVGSKAYQGRFGTTMVNAGDINQDGFTDVAIGAPYENERGVIYIYEGTSAGIYPEYSQRITAEEIDPTLSGFGISISRGKDIDSNNYPDLLIGSYDSDSAVLLRTRPIVGISAIIKFSPTQINTNSSFCNLTNTIVPCFNTSYCLLYTGNHVPLTLDVSTELSSSRQRDVLKPQRYLLYQNKFSSYLRENVTITKNAEKCFHHSTYVTQDSDDFITPINMNLKFWLTHDISSETGFCKTCPMLDPNLHNSVNEIITFQTGCKESTTCLSDLIVKAGVLDELSSEGLVLGLHKVITISVEVKNVKEEAYMTKLQIILDDQVQVINPDVCSPLDEDKNKILICNVGNPLRTNQIERYNIKLDTSQISNDLDELVFKFSATTASVEENPENNNYTVFLPLKIFADITIIGYTEQEQIVFGKNQNESNSIEFDHYYSVFKFLPSTINSVSINFYIPTTFHETNITFLQLTSVQINDGKTESVAASCNVTRINLKPENAGYEKNKEVNLENDIFGDLNKLAAPRSKRNAEDNDYKKADSLTTRKTENYINYVLNCTTAICERIVCAAGPFTNKKKSATFHIKGVLNITILQDHLKNWDNITILSEGKVKIKDQKQNIQPENHQPDEAKVATTLVQSAPLPPKKLPIWILAVSIGAGILLLLLILIGLIKFGFFKRKKKEEMQRMTTQALLEEWDPYLVTDEEVQKAKEAYMNNNTKTE